MHKGIVILGQKRASSLTVATDLESENFLAHSILHTLYSQERKNERKKDIEFSP